MADVTQEAIQLLLDHPKGQGMIVSCYADTSVKDGFHRVWSQRLKNEAGAIEQQLRDDPRARARFALELEIIRQTLDQPAVQRTRGMAVFSASDRGFFQAFSLGVPVSDRLVLDERPYIVPLLEALHRQRRYLLVLTDSHHARLYEAAWGHAQLLQEIDEPVPRRQRSAGELWGKQQATIARHREDHVLHYLKDLASAIDHVWSTAPFRGLILLGERRTVEALRGLLAPALAARVVHTGPYSWAAGKPDLDAKSQEVLDAALHAHDASLIAQVERRLQEHHLIAVGPQDVINALWNGQVGYPGYLVLESDRGDRAARCMRCESVFTTIYDTCPVCQGACEKVNLWQQLLLFAARHNIVAHIVTSHPLLGQHGGVVALLSRSEPWEPATTDTDAGAVP